jgi:hypothetical protein
MKKLLAMLPLMAVLAGCSAGVRGGARVYVVREPSVFPAYSWSHTWYGYPHRPLHAWIGLGTMNPFFYYEFYLSYCSRYGSGAFVPEDPEDSFGGEVPPSSVPKVMKVAPAPRISKPRSEPEARAALERPALRPDRESGERTAVAPSRGSGRGMGSRDPNVTESRVASSRGSSGHSESGRGSSERSEKSSGIRKKK